MRVLSAKCKGRHEHFLANVSRGKLPQLALLPDMTYSTPSFSRVTNRKAYS